MRLLEGGGRELVAGYCRTGEPVGVVALGAGAAAAAGRYRARLEAAGRRVPVRADAAIGSGLWETDSPVPIALSAVDSSPPSECG